MEMFDTVKKKKHVVIGMVKLVQKLGLEGNEGTWKNYLNVHGGNLGWKMSDPSRRTTDFLLKFLETFKKKEDMQLLTRAIQCFDNIDMIKEFKEESTEETREQILVRRTVQHYRYPVNYVFPSYNKDWIVTKTGDMKSIKMLAMSSETILCEFESKAEAVRVCLVDRDLKVVLNKLVKPEQNIHKQMKKHLAGGTILVGHSLHNVLKLLKIDHARVIDTAAVFTYANARNSPIPSLTNLCKSLLGCEVGVESDAYKCVQNATAAMKLVCAVVEGRLPTTIPQTAKMLEADKRRLEVEKSKLFLHKILNKVSSGELEGLITGEFTLTFMSPKKVGGLKSAIVLFKSPEEAQKAFDNIDGDLLEDKVGFPQKLLEFKLNSGEGASIYVRKAVEFSAAVRSKRKRDNIGEREESVKKQKRENDSDSKESHVNSLMEIENLKEELKLKDKEIAQLRKKLGKRPI